MRIAILGATSQIAQSFVSHATAEGKHDFYFLSRSIDRVIAQIQRLPMNKNLYAAVEYTDFHRYDYDAIINFIGSGDPARTANMGSAIYDVTTKFDDSAIAYILGNPRTRYIFLSSGAVYGNAFTAPVDVNTSAVVPINTIGIRDYYSLAKLCAELRHRMLLRAAIVDVRVFNYFSRNTDINARFFVTDMLRAIRDNREFETNSSRMYRDFIAPTDFHALIMSILAAPPTNTAVDVYSKGAVEKFVLLSAMQREFGLRYKITSSASIVSATGEKPNYYSTNQKAAEFGYAPRFTSLETILYESHALLEGIGNTEDELQP